MTGLEYGLRTGRSGGNLLTALKAVRDCQLAHNIPAKAEGGPRLFYRDLFDLIHDSAGIVDALCRAFSIAGDPLQAAGMIWHERGLDFWRFLAGEKQPAPDGTPLCGALDA